MLELRDGYGNTYSHSYADAHTYAGLSAATGLLEK